MEISEILIKAKAVIENPDNWIQEYFAFDKNNCAVGRGTHPDAVRFCSVGAIQKVVGEEFFDCYKIQKAKMALTIASGESITDYNDTHTHYEVMKVWDKAIENSLQKEKE